MQTASSSQSHINVHLHIVPDSHDQLRCGRVGNANELGMHLSALGRSGCSAASVVQPLAVFVLPKERLVSETELLPKIVCHEWWAYELTEGVRSRSTRFLPNHPQATVSLREIFFFLSNFCLLNLVLWVVVVN